jgi:hypothetical protein
VKQELTFLERGYMANLCRRRAAELRENIQRFSTAAVRAELTAEAKHVEEMARRYDDGEDPLSEKQPIQVNPRIDLDQLDAPQKNGGGDAMR